MKVSVAVIVALLGTGFVGQAMAADAPAAFTPCKACHKVEAGAKAIGPSLFGIFDTKAGTGAKEFKYSPAMTGWGKVWDDATLAAYLANPKDTIPGNKMLYAGVKSPDDIAALIAYIKSLK